ncbi:MAG: NAD(P)H-hydrate dehydratase [Fimbriimonadaceae bacterium]|nr:NAD(P)H-hydrate dehydratase [Fimbriimonadaceae bacterium]QYK57729.1 MAG: NAD(P)H-hydrate dehydratase [Fimbriimonadaceae bacterium]
MWIADLKHSRDLDRRATEQYGVPAMVLMERAGLAVFEALRELLPEGGRVIVICGAGNNGGDGFVVARLALEAGYAVECLVAAQPEDLREECRQQLQQAEAQGIRPIFPSDARWARRLDCLGCYDLIVDALLGIGIHGEVKGPVREAIEAINRSGVPALSVDVPSGIETDTGLELGVSVWALRTVTFGLPKPFLFQGRGLEHCGYWSVADIGFPQTLLREPTGAKTVDRAWVAGLLPERLKDSHKGTNGHVLIVAGSRSMRGAAVLAAKSAIRAGAGLVTVAGIEPVIDVVASHVPEALLMPLAEDDGRISPRAVDTVLTSGDRFSGAVFGPGTTHDDPVVEFLSGLWSRWEVPSVIDADALNAVALGVGLPPCDAVLTPHPGELSRTMQVTVAEIQSDRFRAAREASAKFGKTVLLKGAHSIVASPDDTLLVNGTGNPGMASGGMGDVLSGVIGALLGQELPSYLAAACGMTWHGLAGDLCARQIAPVGYTATEVAEALPQARAKLTEPCDPPS